MYEFFTTTVEGKRRIWGVEPTRINGKLTITIVVDDLTATTQYREGLDEIRLMITDLTPAERDMFSTIRNILRTWKQ